MMKIVDNFSLLSQAKINTDKTEIIKLNKSRLALPWKIKPSNQPIRHLGVYLNKDGLKTSLMENNLLSKFYSKSKPWYVNSLSIIGRVRLVNIFINSQTYFLAQGIPFSINFIKKLKEKNLEI